MIINKLKRKKRIKEWLARDFEESLEYYYAQKLKKYKFNPLEVTIWYIDVENNYMQFVSHSKYYELRDDKINEIEQKDVWIKKIRYKGKKKDSR
ncbi:MAG: hypothetical protein OSJ70_08340 [Bacilli bacterium]|nr:hypothetical protein [Bacilli bacterium]